MKQCRFSQWVIFWALLFLSTAYAERGNEIPHQFLKIVSGDHQLPIVSQPTVLKHTLLSFGDTYGSAVKVFAPDSLVKPHEVSESRSRAYLPDMDQLWVFYRAASGSNNSIFSGNIRALALPLSVRQSGLLTDTPLYISSDREEIITHEKVLPQDVNYLIRRQIGIYNNIGWHMTERENSIILKHLTRIDMHKISSIEFEIDGMVKGLNFRFSRKASGIPTHIVTWQDIPKVIIEHKTTQRVKLDIASILQNITGTMEDRLPLYLIEIIVFIDKTKFTDEHAAIKIPLFISSPEGDKSTRLLPPAILTPKIDVKNLILTLRDVPLSTDVKANLYLRWLTIILYVVFFIWVLIFWRLRTTQRNFFVGNRQGLNLLLLLTVLVYTFLRKFFSINLSIEGEEIGLLIFSAFAALHAWRWHLQFSPVKRFDVKLSWMVGQGKWPPLAVWVLTATILVIMVVVQWQVPFTATEEQIFMTNLAASDMSSALEILILRVLLILNEQVLNLPVMLAFGYGFLPWIWAFSLKKKLDLTEILYSFFAIILIESLFFRVALVMLIATAVMLSVNLEPIAEQLAIIAYFSLVTGAVLAALSLRKGDKTAVDIPNRE